MYTKSASLSIVTLDGVWRVLWIVESKERLPSKPP